MAIIFALQISCTLLLFTLRRTGQVASSLLQFAASVCGATPDTVLTPAIAIFLASLNLLINGASIALLLWTRKLD
jgi:hypothetical protein